MGDKSTGVTYNKIRITTGLPPLIDGGTYVGTSDSLSVGAVNLSVSKTTQKSLLHGDTQTIKELSISGNSPIAPNLSVDQNGKVNFGVNADVGNDYVGAEASALANINGQLTISVGGVFDLQRNGDIDSTGGMGGFWTTVDLNLGNLFYPLVWGVNEHALDRVQSAAGNIRLGGNDGSDRSTPASDPKNTSKGQTKGSDTISGPKTVNVTTTVNTPAGPKTVWVDSSYAKTAADNARNAVAAAKTAAAAAQQKENNRDRQGGSSSNDTSSHGGGQGGSTTKTQKDVSTTNTGGTGGKVSTNNGSSAPNTGNNPGNDRAYSQQKTAPTEKIDRRTQNGHPIVIDLDSDGVELSARGGSTAPFATGSVRLGLNRPTSPCPHHASAKAETRQVRS